MPPRAGGSAELAVDPDRFLASGGDWTGRGRTADVVVLPVEPPAAVGRQSSGERAADPGRPNCRAREERELVILRQGLP